MDARRPAEKIEALDEAPRPREGGAIGALIAPLVPSGATIQLGIGRVIRPLLSSYRIDLYGQVNAEVIGLKGES